MQSCTQEPETIKTTESKPEDGDRIKKVHTHKLRLKKILNYNEAKREI